MDNNTKTYSLKTSIRKLICCKILIITILVLFNNVSPQSKKIPIAIIDLQMLIPGNGIPSMVTELENEIASLDDFLLIRSADILKIIGTENTGPEIIKWQKWFRPNSFSAKRIIGTETIKGKNKYKRSLRGSRIGHWWTPSKWRVNGQIFKDETNALKAYNKWIAEWKSFRLNNVAGVGRAIGAKQIVVLDDDNGGSGDLFVWHYDVETETTLRLRHITLTDGYTKAVILDIVKWLKEPDQSARKKHRVAIMNLNTGRKQDTQVEISISNVRAITNRLVSEIVKLNIFEIYDRSMMDQIIGELDFQQSGITDENLIDIGKIAGVEFIIGGSVSKLGDTYTISIRRIEVETGRIIKTADIDKIKSLDSLLSDKLDELAIEISAD